MKIVDCTTEKKLLMHFYYKLTLQSPQIIYEGDFHGWKFVLLSHVEGSSFADNHKEKGISNFWIDQISNLLNDIGPAVLALDDYRIIHADLNHEHIQFQKSTC
ncbi:MAG: hypothetical protein AB7O96_08570 [Pseudobdellovibrionaceae bacterium]